MRTATVEKTSLIPVLVTGIQPRRVCAVNDSFAPKDLGALDSCDKHRNEGRWSPIIPQAPALVPPSLSASAHPRATGGQTVKPAHQSS
ncbi:hypothetical protein CPJ18_13300 [Agrobacterium rosae]|uniref:Uncharacterized protein n=1 Tax=Agrobacterium rosae TaxID=1972867 RepID=A0AAE5RXA8_9HYPH|nr:hypothetical protein CPJ18_13300 [Agrobacterium rosae]